MGQGGRGYQIIQHAVKNGEKSHFQNFLYNFLKPFIQRGIRKLYIESRKTFHVKVFNKIQNNFLMDIVIIKSAKNHIVGHFLKCLKTFLCRVLYLLCLKLLFFY